MSRIGKKPLLIPLGTEVKVDNDRVIVKGPKGSLDFEFNKQSKIEVAGNEVIVSNVGKAKNSSAIWGTTARIIENMIKGVTEGFQKQLELNGVGFRMNIQGKKIVLALGFSHPVEVEVPPNIEVKIENNVMTIAGIDKQKVGQFSADIKKLKPVEPYKGKGFKYVGEIVRRKEGKKASAS